MNRAQVYEATGQTGRALEDYDKAIQLDRKFNDVYLNRGCLRADEGKLDEAIDDLTTFLRKSSSRPPVDLTFAYFYRGRSWAVKHEHDTALADFDMAVKDSPPEAKAQI